LKPDSDEAQLALAEAALHEKMYGQAKAYLKTAEKIRPSKKLYRLYARLEKMQLTDSRENAMNDDVDPRAVQKYVERAVDAADNKKWVCRITGAVYPQWSIFAAPHNGFNTIVWDYPEKYYGSVAAVDVIGAHDEGALFSVLSPSDGKVKQA